MGRRMRLSGIWLLYRPRLRVRAVLVGEGFAILGIAVGVALLFASQVASTSLTRSVTELTSQIVGNQQQFQLQARGPDGFDERLLAEVRRLPGVKVSLPVLEQQVNLVGPSGQRSVDLIGTDPSFARIGGPLLQRFSAAQLSAQKAVALPAPLAAAIGAGPLQVIKLQIGASVTPILIGATLAEGDVGGLVHSPVAIAPVSYAQKLTGLKGRVTRIFIGAKPGHTQQVRRELGALAGRWGVNLEPANFDERLFAVAVAPENESEQLFSAISALVGFMLALNAILVTVPSRRKLIEEVRPQGASRLMTAQILLFHAALIGVLACTLGLVLGEALSLAAFHATPGYLSFAFPIGDDRIVTWQSVALAVGVGLLASLGGVFWPLRSIFARPRDGGEPHRGIRGGWPSARLLAGLLGLAVTTVILLLDARAAVIGNAALLLALVCLLPFLFDAVVSAFDRVQRSTGGAATILAVTHLQNPVIRVRSLAVAATAAIAVFGIVEFGGVQADLTSGLDASARAIDSGAQLWVIPGGESNAFATTQFSPTSEKALADLPGVQSLGIYRGGFLDWGDRRLWVLAPPASSREPVPSSQITNGHGLASTRIREGGWAVLSTALASEHHLHVGETFTLPAPTPTQLRVAALSTNLGWPPGAMILNSRDYARAWGSNSPSAYEIQGRPGVAPQTLQAEIRSALGRSSGLRLETSAQRTERHFRLATQGLSRLTQIRRLVLLAALLAVAGAMGAMMWQRREQIALMRVEGYRRKVLWRWLVCESAVLLAAGCSIGAVFGLYAQLLGSHFLSTVTGFPIVYNVEALSALSSFGLVSVLAVAFVAVPGYFVVRVPPSTVSPAY